MCGTNFGHGANFNSHAHVERDPFSSYAYLFAPNFNSHAHVERDSPVNFSIFTLVISTHTLTWSVTVYR